MRKYGLTAVCVVSCTALFASDKTRETYREKQVPQTVVRPHDEAPFTKVDLSAETKVTPQPRATTTYSATQTDGSYKPFTGKVLGGNVRMRLTPDVESPVVKELTKGELIVVTGERNDFFAVEPPTDLKAYIFRSFVLDNVVEGNRVNIRLAPELNAPVIGFMNSGDRVNGAVSDKNHKWLEIAIPKTLRFFIAKEYLEKAGGPDLKASYDKKRESVVQLMDSSELLSQSEMMKPFEEIDFVRVSENYSSIVHDYSEFPEYAEKAKAKLMELQESYLQKKLAYLESRTGRMAPFKAQTIALVEEERELSPSERMKIWERVEESLYLAWAAAHHQKTMNDYYEDQKTNAIKISGIVDTYNDVVKNKPGNYLLRDRDMPRSYLYSTFVNLHNYQGKYVTLIVAPRPNNNFAFPAYFVLDVQ